jgi:HD-GYP domain-containing protein (c-di-GMP phosphodiesterase class II)/putative methionine-R-sulfoxide reductase with GAF domain
MSETSGCVPVAAEERAALLQRLELLHRADLILQSATDRGLLFRPFLDLMMEAAQAASGTLYLVDEARGELVFAVVHGPAEVCTALQGRRMPIGQGIVGKSVERGEFIWVPVVEHSRDWARDLSARSGYKPQNVLCLPLKAQDRVIGVVQLFDHPPECPYTQPELDFLSVLANDLALKMENAALLGASRDMVARMRALLDVGVELGATLDRKHLLSMIMNQVCDLLTAEAASVFEMDETTGDLVLCATSLPSQQERLPDIRVPPGEGIAGWVAEHCETVLVPDVSQDPRYYARGGEGTGFVTRSILCTPLMVQEQVRGQDILHRRVIGVAQALNKQKDEPFTPGDIEVFEGLARQAAIAMERTRLYRDVNDMFVDMIKALTEAIEAKDPYTRGHTSRVTDASVVIAREMGLPQEEVFKISLSGLLHDIGKIGMPDAILRKPARVTDDELRVIRQHPERGERILRPLRHLREIIAGVVEHHERYDGRGYPHGLKGEAISLAGRVIAVADTFDAMTSDRPYRRGMPVETVLAEIRQQAGRQFDPQMVAAFLQAWDKGLISPPNQAASAVPPA